MSNQADLKLEFDNLIKGLERKIKLRDNESKMSCAEELPTDKSSNTITNKMVLLMSVIFISYPFCENL